MKFCNPFVFPYYISITSENIWILMFSDGREIENWKKNDLNSFDDIYWNKEAWHNIRYNTVKTDNDDNQLVWGWQ